MKKMNNKGFSLVELIVVIAIMAVLIGVLAPQFLKYVEKSRQSTDVQNVQEIKSAIEVYVADTGSDTNCTITIKGGDGGTAEVPSDIIGTDKIEGIKDKTNLKSKTWPTSITFTYSASSGWTAGATTFKNTAKPGLDMVDVFK